MSCCEHLHWELVSNLLGCAGGLAVHARGGGSCAAGEPLGAGFEPPIRVTGALGFGITCEYDNPRAQTVQYGIGDQEMCVVLMYSSGGKAGGMALANLTSSNAGGVHSTDALCVSVGVP